MGTALMAERKNRRSEASMAIAKAILERKRKIMQIPQERHDRSGGTARQSASNGISR